MIYPDADTKRAKPWYTTITDAGIFLSCQATSYATKGSRQKNFYLSDSYRVFNHYFDVTIKTIDGSTAEHDGDSGGVLKAFPSLTKQARFNGRLSKAMSVTDVDWTGEAAADLIFVISWQLLQPGIEGAADGCLARGTEGLTSPWIL